MAANVYQPHLLLLIEDDANRQIVNGFESHPRLEHRRIDPGKPAGGWRVVLEQFQETHIALLRKYPHRHLLMVIDFDAGAAEPAAHKTGSMIERRMALFTDAIPQDLRERVFVIGCADEPEKLVKDTGCHLEEIGRRLAQDCDCGTDEMWAHPMLKHNADEIVRLRARVRPFLFS